MSHIERLIADLCPDGVEFRTIDQLVNLDFGTRITKLNDSGTKFPVYGGGGASFRTDRWNREDEYVISRFAMSEICVRKVQGKFWLLDSGFTYSMKSTEAEKDFLAYWLLANQPRIYACSSQGAQKNLKTRDFKKFRIPVPPIEVQREIVRILDNFSQLEAELEAELEARRKQYEFYRDQLFHTHGRTVTLGEIGRFVRGSGIQKADLTESGRAAIHYGEIHTHYGVWAASSKSFLNSTYNKAVRLAEPGDLVIATTSEDDEAVGKATAWLGRDDVAVSTDAFIFRHSANPKYVSYFFASSHFQDKKRRFITGTKVRRISGQALAKIPIPLPSLAEQERIVEILDKFDALVNDLSIGLPAELQARRKQYEYYRDRLLTFEEINA